jgi:hypothetical protein
MTYKNSLAATPIHPRKKAQKHPFCVKNRQFCVIFFQSKLSLSAVLVTILCIIRDILLTAKFIALFGAKTMKTLTLRLPDVDHALFAHLAKQEFMSVSSLIRRQMYRFAKEQGIDVGVDSQIDTPFIKPPVAVGLPARPRNNPPVAWYGHTIYDTYRLYTDLTEAGHPDQAIADWYCKPVQDLLDRVSEARGDNMTEEQKRVEHNQRQAARAALLGKSSAQKQPANPKSDLDLDELFD